MQLEAVDIFENMGDTDVWLKVQGTSMRPFLHGDRDTVILRKFADRPCIGDIVVYCKNGFYIMHRVITVEEDTFTALGDNQRTPDRLIPISDIRAKVVGAVRDGKKISPSSAVWKFYSKIYINQNIRKTLTKIISWR